MPLPVRVLVNGRFTVVLIRQQILSDLIASTIESAFQNGTFLSTLPASLIGNETLQFAVRTIIPFSNISNSNKPLVDICFSKNHRGSVFV